MRTDTRTITIAASPSDVLALVGDVEQLPRWAVGFARSVRRVGDRWVVTTGQGGDVPVDVAVDPAAGLVDFRIEAAPGVESVARVHVRPHAEGTEVGFTQQQEPGMSDEVFDAQVAAVRHELTVLKALLEVACPA
jgi:hypothetical protein